MKKQKPFEISENTPGFAKHEKKRCSEEIQTRISRLKELLSLPSADVSWSRYNSADEAVAELEALEKGVLNGNPDALSTLRLLLAPTGALQEISISSGWGYEFLVIAEALERAMSTAGDPLTQIEQEFSFTYPRLYRKLYKDGMLDWGKFGPNGYGAYWEKLKDNPPLLLFGKDIELLDWERIAEEIEAFRDPNDYRGTKPEHQFVPIAQTGGGDLYVFQFEEADGENVPIALVFHDSNRAVVLAKNLQDFIFRMLLEAGEGFDEHSRLLNGNIELNGANILKTHKPYLTQKQYDIILKLYKEKASDYVKKVQEKNHFPKD